MSTSLSEHKLLIANRGEIAVRILRTARKLGIPTVAVYTRTDSTAPHVTLADEAVSLHSDDPDPLSNSRGYLDAQAIVEICRARNVTLVHPGYGFLSENADFARELEKNGITWLGPSADTVDTMGLKHEARKIAVKAGVPVVPGSDGLLVEVDLACDVAKQVQYPVMLKSTAGGGGMGLVVCADEEELRKKFISTQERAKSLFHNDGLFLERFFPASRHIEIQIFGNGVNHVMHMGERECSVQRRYQKVIEETPSPFLDAHPGLREEMCAAAVRLCQEIGYTSAGTVEFIVDDTTAAFFFLEMNTRIQVEHTITEAARPGLDIVELQILQGIAQRSTHPTTLPPPLLTHPHACPAPTQHAIQARIYCENPAANFTPAPGVLQHVFFPEHKWLRVDTWVETGTEVTPFFDPLVAKVVVTGGSRAEAVRRLEEVLGEARVCGPPNNIAYLRAVCNDARFEVGKATTTFLDKFKFTPCAVGVLAGGLSTTIQDLPGRTVGLGIPPSGPLDALAHRAANILVGNAPGIEALEITLLGPTLLFYAPAVIALTGAPVDATLDGEAMPMWTRIEVRKGARLHIGTVKEGWRCYMAIKGGFPDVPGYLGSKSTSMGLGGYQGRALTAGDQLTIASYPSSIPSTPASLPPALIPAYPSHWTIYVLSGPHSDDTFLTPSGLASFFSTRWTVSAASNRMGIRLSGPSIGWARESGGEGGSHPSNVLDGAYALGSVNLNGDTPVILTNEGPDMGGYACVCTVASAEMWKIGQLRPGNTIEFRRITWEQAMELNDLTVEYLDQVSLPRELRGDAPSPLLMTQFNDTPQDPKLYIVEGSGERPRAVFRQAGDSAILLEYGEMALDFHVRARVHAFERELERRDVAGVRSVAPCIRSTMIRFDPTVISQPDLLSIVVAVDRSLPDTTHNLSFPGRKLIFPIVLDDQWNREALERYSRAVRDEAVYLPSNIEYLARNNGLKYKEEALKLLVQTDWLVFGVGFYLACPFLVPVDPRCRLVGQKMNPSRTFTPRGAIGIAGLVAAIYPIESPGGYQLFGRSLPPWQTWGRGHGFKPSEPWLLRPFDQVTFKAVSEEAYVGLEQRFDAGQYVFEIEDVTFSMAKYQAFVDLIADEVKAFQQRQAEATKKEEVREMELLARWQERKKEEELREQSATPAESFDDMDLNGHAVNSSLTATIWKIACKPGDVVRSAEDVLVVLEAMKTEVNITAGAENVGRTVRGFGREVRQGSLVQAGDVLVVLD